MPGYPWSPGANAVPIGYTSHNRLRLREGRIQPAPEFVVLAAPPEAPANLACVTFSSSRIDLSWDNVANETGFRIERSLFAIGPWVTAGTVGPNVLTFSDMGLAASTTFFYRVFAFNPAGDSPPSNVTNCTTDPTPPGPGRHEPGKWMKRYFAHRIFGGNRLGDWID